MNECSVYRGPAFERADQQSMHPRSPRSLDFSAFPAILIYCNGPKQARADEIRFGDFLRADLWHFSTGAVRRIKHEFYPLKTYNGYLPHHRHASDWPRFLRGSLHSGHTFSAAAALTRKRCKLNISPACKALAITNERNCPMSRGTIQCYRAVLAEAVG